MATSSEDDRFIEGRVRIPRPVGNSDEALKTEHDHMVTALDHELDHLKVDLIDEWETQAEAKRARLQ